MTSKYTITYVFVVQDDVLRKWFTDSLDTILESEGPHLLRSLGLLPTVPSRLREEWSYSPISDVRILNYICEGPMIVIIAKGEEATGYSLAKNLNTLLGVAVSHSFSADKGMEGFEYFLGDDYVIDYMKELITKGDS